MSGFRLAIEDELAPQVNDTAQSVVVFFRRLAGTDYVVVYVHRSSDTMDVKYRLVNTHLASSFL